MNRKQWFVLAGLFFILFISLSGAAHPYDKFQETFEDFALKKDNSCPSDSLTFSEAFMVSENIYRMGSYFAFVLTLGFFICGFLEPKQKH